MTTGLRYRTRCAIIAMLTVALTFNTALAGRGLRGLCKLRKQCAPVACCEPAPNSNQCPVPVEACSPAPPVCCDSSSVGSAPAAEASSWEQSSQTGSAQWSDDSSQPAAPEQPPAPEQPAAPEASPSDSADDANAPPAPFFTDPQVTPSQEPAPTPPGEDVPVDPAPEQPDPFGAPDEPAPVEPESQPPTADALFGESAEGEAADSPTESEPAPETDNLFDTPIPEEPTEPDPSEPAINDDLFSDPAGESNLREDLFGTPDATESEAPAAEPADDDPFPAQDASENESTTDNLFDNAPDSTDELFGTPEEGAAADAGDEQEGADIFGDPAAVSVDSDYTGDFESLFGTPPAPADSDNATDASSRDAVKSTSTRLWRDNTGNFEVSAELAVIYPDKVRLLKENGNFTTVPLRRLSETDRLYVQQIAANLPGGEVKYISIMR